MSADPRAQAQPVTLTKRQAKRYTCGHWAHVIKAKATTEGHGSITCPMCDEWPEPKSECASCRRIYAAQLELIDELHRREGHS